MDSDPSDRATTLELQKLVAYLDSYLEIEEFDDFCPNGLQVEGRSSVECVITGVSASAELFQRARERNADAIVVHHGLFWRGTSRALTGVQLRRVRELIAGDMSLLAYHLPLDSHRQIGNNWVAAKRMGLSRRQPFGDIGGRKIGVAGKLEAPLGRAEVIDLVTSLYEQEPLAFLYGGDVIESIAIVSGAGARALDEAADAGLDLFLTGEAEEWTMQLAKEYELNCLAAGHYATERLGVQAIASLLEERFGLDVEFIDLPNPV